MSDVLLRGITEKVQPVFMMNDVLFIFANMLNKISGKRSVIQKHNTKV